MKTAEMKQKRTDNKGFSLVELIIVMAIMAIMVGIVGTQAVPYLNRAREAKDRELLSAISTAAVTAYTENVEDLPTAGFTVTDLYTDEADAAIKAWQDDVKTLISYNTLPLLKGAGSSDQIKTKVSAIEIIVSTPATGARTLTVTATGTTLDPVVSQL